MNWTEDISAAQWQEWTKFAAKVARKNEKVPTSLGFEDYAAQAIEKLIAQPVKPDNVQGWLTTAINRMYIDRFRKILMRGGPSVRELSDEQWEEEMISKAAGGPSAVTIAKHRVTEVLSVLSDKEKELLILAAAGYENNQIAIYADYKNGKVVATRLKQIYEKVRKALQIQAP